MRCGGGFTCISIIWQKVSTLKATALKGKFGYKVCILLKHFSQVFLNDPNKYIEGSVAVIFSVVAEGFEPLACYHISGQCAYLKDCNMHIEREREKEREREREREYINSFLFAVGLRSAEYSKLFCKQKCFCPFLTRSVQFIQGFFIILSLCVSYELYVYNTITMVLIRRHVGFKGKRDKTCRDLKYFHSN